jgi:nucleotide-binding universal stress UspA family protein
MFRSILVPLDGSTFGAHALPLALGIARRAGASVQLLLVVPPVSSLYAEAPLFAEDRSLDDRMRERQRMGGMAYLQSVIERVKARSTVPTTPLVVEGELPETIHEQIKYGGTDLVVMTTHGRGPLGRFWLGSVADGLVRTAQVPVLLVRPQETAPDLGQEPILKHLLLPVDGSDLAEQILQPAISLGRLMDADYTLLRVVKPVLLPSYIPEGTNLDDQSDLLTHDLQNRQRLLREEAEKYLEGLAARFRADSLRVDMQVVVAEQPAAAILEEAQKRGSDLIALETHGRRGLERLFLGSVADKIVRGSTLPVLVCRPKEQ